MRKNMHTHPGLRAPPMCSWEVQIGYEMTARNRGLSSPRLHGQGWFPVILKVVSTSKGLPVYTIYGINLVPIFPMHPPTQVPTCAAHFNTFY